MKGNRTRKGISFLILAICLFSTVFSSVQVNADDEHSGVADSSQMSKSSDVVQYGMLPIYGRDVVDGEYEIGVDSSSSFFHVNKVELTVKGDTMKARLIMASHSYELLYPGTAEDAAKAPASDYIVPTEDSDGNYVYDFDVEALNKGMYCAAFSKNRKLWYDRQILFNAGTLPKEALKVELPDYHRIQWAMDVLDKQQAEQNGGDSSDSSSQEATTQASSQPQDVEDDGTSREAFIKTEPMEISKKDGEYSIEVNMTGGSGRASISSPTLFLVSEGKAFAKLIWSSTYYDYMIVGGKKYKNETLDGGNSTFTIPISQMDVPIPVIADTTAMGDPVEIEYHLTFYEETIGEKGLIPQEAAKKVLMIAIVVIVVGAILNHFVKVKRKGK